MESVQLSRRKYFIKSAPDRYTLIHITEGGRQEIHLTAIETIKMLQGVMDDFGKEMPKGVKVVMKMAGDK